MTATPIETYDVGDLIRLFYTFTDADGNGLNPTAVSLRISLPDGTFLTPAPVAEGLLGAYRYDLSITQAGRWVYRWSGTGAVETGEEFEFQVRKRKVAAA